MANDNSPKEKPKKRFIQPNPTATQQEMANQNASESRGEYRQGVDIQQRRQEAIDAEAEWLSQVRQAPSNDNRRNNKIRLSSPVFKPRGKTVRGAKIDIRDDALTDTIEFDLSPDISESKQVIYAEIGDIRQAASILIYGGSPSRKWSVQAKFLSRTEEEADATWKNVQLLRAWSNPDANYKYGADTFGTPHVLRLHGYGRTWKGIPVVLTGVNVEYPSDIDYIPTTYGTGVPVIQAVSFQLTEARTPDDLLKNFDMEKFKRGILPEW